MKTPKRERIPGRFGAAPQALIERTWPGPTPAAAYIATYVVLDYLQGASAGGKTITHRTLMRLTGIRGREHMIRILDELEAAGWIHQEKSKGRATRYEVNRSHVEAVHDQAGSIADLRRSPEVLARSSGVRRRAAGLLHISTDLSSQLTGHTAAEAPTCPLTGQGMSSQETGGVLSQDTRTHPSDRYIQEREPAQPTTETPTTLDAELAQLAAEGSDFARDALSRRARRASRTA